MTSSFDSSIAADEIPTSSFNDRQRLVMNTIHAVFFVFFDGDRLTLQHMLGGRVDISRGCKASPLKSLCTIKDTRDYRAGWMVLGNLDSFEGETFAPTASKKEP